MFRVTIEGLKLYKYYALAIKSEHKSALKHGIADIRTWLTEGRNSQGHWAVGHLRLLII